MAQTSGDCRAWRVGVRAAFRPLCHAAHSGRLAIKLAGESYMSRKISRTNRLRPLAGLIAAGLAAPAFAASVEFPTYVPGPQPDGSFVVGNGQVITPAGTQVDLGIRVRAKAVAVNPKAGTHTAAVLVLGANQAVEVFDTLSGEVLQNYVPGNN